MTEEEKELFIPIEVEEKKQVEVSLESIVERQQVLDLIKGGADEIAQEERKRKEARKKEVVELRNGTIIPYDQYIADSLQEYFAVFPNDNPFFSEMFRLAGWRGDPKQYVKPPLARLYLVEIIYYRFHKEILPRLKAKAIPGKHKLFQLLTDEGIERIFQFRDEAVNMMKEFNDGQIYEFRLAYSAKFKTDVQLELI